MNNHNNSFINETRDNIQLPIPSIWRSEFIVGNIVLPGVLRLNEMTEGGVEDNSIGLLTGSLNEIPLGPVSNFRQGVPGEGGGLFPVIRLLWEDHQLIGYLTREVVNIPVPGRPGLIVYRFDGSLYSNGTTAVIPWRASMTKIF
ncbi:hypothetical protein P4H71_04555 [Paenibacillus kribbensis]|uniref:hypothetical protein n=1 Tax=Paenibacillus TaxID=44249 RepID=UPI00024EF995|nr:MULTISPECIES: hypothetical protein [Paenibacillus]EHS58404.1 hypothetical protein WG8_1664 [Paenibacillus sp. Aloe-11]MEC0233625.1 hypothetical protein [Paenibacillus kribbensis]